MVFILIRLCVGHEKHKTTKYGHTEAKKKKKKKTRRSTWNVIRILSGCEVLIENSVTRVTVRHHEACRVMPNSNPSDRIFNLYRRTIMDSFSCIFFIRKLHLNLNMWCFINLTLKKLHFSIKKILVWFLSYTLISKRLAETDVKMTSIRQKWRQTSK